MKKIISSLILISSLNISISSCSYTESIATVKPISQQVWLGETENASSTLTISKISDNNYTFIEHVIPKKGMSFETGGTMYYNDKEAVIRYAKPNNSQVRAKYELSDDKTSFTYLVNSSDTELAKIGQKFTYKKK